MTRTKDWMRLISAATVVTCASLALAAPPPGYYDSVDVTGAPALRASLHDIIDDHTRFPYTSSATDTWDILEQADEDPSNSGNILDVYKNATYMKFGGGNSFYNREHSWPKSYGFPNDFSGNYPYTDCHHLFLCDSGYNSSRSNKPYRFCTSGCSEKPTDVNNGQGGPGQSNWTAGSFENGTWETWIGRRGNVARAQFYMDVRYEGGTHSITGDPEPDLILTDNQSLIVPDASNNQSVAYMGILSDLIAWHAEDPVDAVEQTHTDVVASHQGNRNPFVDYPEWVAVVFEGQTLNPWINEFHYDNDGADTGEFVEVMGLESMDLTGWQVVGYNGNGGVVYDTVTINGALPAATECFSAGWVDFPGMQNGPDGLALVSPGGQVVQFISYEGSFTATDGPAAGMTSIDIGVSETGTTPVGHSLQLEGSAAGYSQFFWAAPSANSQGAVNANQTLEGSCGDGGGGDPPPSADPWINEFHYDNDGSDTGEFVEVAGPQGMDLTDWQIVGYNGNGGAVYDTLIITGSLPSSANCLSAAAFDFPGMQNGSPDGLALVRPDGSVVQFISYEGSFTATDGPASGMASTDVGVSETSSTPIGFSLQLEGTGAQYSDFTWAGPSAESPGSLNANQVDDGSCGGGGDPPPPPPPATDPWVNEFHYDNRGGDTGEFVEIAGPAGLDLTNWTIVGYNGSNGREYNTIPLSGTINDLGAGTGVASFGFDGMQNGSPDGIALVDPNGTVIQFLSYEGSFTASDGPASGMTSTDVGVNESNSTPWGDSLQLSGSGCQYSDFTWQSPDVATSGAANNNQTFTTGCN